MASSSINSSKNVSIRPERTDRSREIRKCLSPSAEVKPSQGQGRRMPLMLDFYARDTVQVACGLLGKLLEVKDRSGSAMGRIVETEAYAGDEDAGSHWHLGETPRSQIAFGDPGYAYVYLIYGNYEMLNIVTERRGTPGAVLIRALEPIEGVERMARRRKGVPVVELANGPGKLCRALGIRMSDNGVAVDGSRIRLYSDGYLPSRILASPRVGLTRGTEIPWRFFIESNPHVSKSPLNRRAVPL